MQGRKLTDAFVRSVDRAGKYGDQHGLILRVRPTGSKQWIWRGTVAGRRVDLGLGGYPYTTLREARNQAFEYRRAARSGRHPKALGRNVPTFSEAAERVIEIHRSSWRAGSGSEVDWRRTLRLYAMPRLGAMRVSEIDTADVMAVLLPIWGAKAVTARRVRQRIGAVMRWAIAQGYRAGQSLRGRDYGGVAAERRAAGALPCAAAWRVGGGAGEGAAGGGRTLCAAFPGVSDPDRVASRRSPGKRAGLRLTGRAGSGRFRPHG